MEYFTFGFILQVFLSFIAIMNPIGNTPIFLSLVSHLPEAEHRKVALNGVLFAFGVVVVFTLGGNIIFRLFGITLPAFRIAGGILLFMIAYNLVRARRSHQHHPTEEEHPKLFKKEEEIEEIEEEAKDIAITPLGTPILAGPGTITTALSLVGKKSDFLSIFIVISIFGLVCLLTYFCFIYGELLTRRLKPSAIGAMTRLMGLILSVVAVQMIIEGVADVVLEIVKRL
jgi:multiple antibiotic resistance protein